MMTRAADGYQVSSIKRLALADRFKQDEKRFPSCRHVQLTPHTMTPTYQIPKNPSSQLKTVLHYLDCVEVFDLAEIEKLFADDLVQSTAPHNLDVPKRSKQEDLAFLRGLSEQLEGKSFEVKLFAPRRRRFPPAPLRAW